MKNKIVISVFVCFLLAYVGCKKAELDTPQAPPIDLTNYSYNAKVLNKNSHFTLDELNQYTIGNKGKCNKCHTISSK